MTEAKKKKKGRGAGRPKIPLITPDLGAVDKKGKIAPRPIILTDVYYWMDLQATAEEISGSFRVSVDTLNRRLKEATGHSFAELKEKVCGGCKIQLRKNQLNLTKTSAAMGIWLGKVWLNQKDVEHLKEIIKDFSHLIRMVKEGDLEGKLTQPEHPPRGE